MSKSMSLAFLYLVLLYLLSLSYLEDFLWLLKIFPVALLVFGVLKTGSSSTRSILLLALVFSSCGDLLLAFDKFIFGVAAFLVAQLSYAVLFRPFWQNFQHRWYFSLLLITHVLVMLWLLFPSLGNLKLPVMTYLMAIAAMGFMAIQSSLPIRWSVLGAILFITSDSLIAINKFYYPLAYESYWIMSTYYAAQFMLVTGFIHTEIKAKNINTELNREL